MEEMVKATHSLRLAIPLGLLLTSAMTITPTPPAPDLIFLGLIEATELVVLLHAGLALVAFDQTWLPGCLVLVTALSSLCVFVGFSFHEKDQKGGWIMVRFFMWLMVLAVSAIAQAVVERVLQLRIRDLQRGKSASLV